MLPAPGRTAENGRSQLPPCPVQEDSPALAVWASPPSSLMLPAPSQFPQHPAVASREAEGEDLLGGSGEGGTGLIWGQGRARIEVILEQGQGGKNLPETLKVKVIWKTELKYLGSRVQEDRGDHGQRE